MPGDDLVPQSLRISATISADDDASGTTMFTTPKRSFVL